MLGVQRWQDVRIWVMLCLCGFLLIVLRSQPSRIRLEIFLCFSFSVLSPIYYFKAEYSH
jgi:hypothetical protein